MATLKELLSKKKSDDFKTDFQELQRLSLQMLNQLANENSQLKKSLEDKSSETIGINSKTQLENSWPEDFPATLQTLKFLSEKSDETEENGSIIEI